MSDTKIAVFTVVVRVPKDENVTGWSVRAIDTKNAWYEEEIVASEVLELDA